MGQRTSGGSVVVLFAIGDEPDMLIGYARVSTDDQRLDLQIDALNQFGIEDSWIYKEQVSGTKTRRPELDACLKALREGDTLVVYRLDRLGRSIKDLTQIIETLEKRGIGFRSLQENVDTTTASGKLVFNIFGAVAQFERDLISERTKAGLAAARTRGAVGGRKPKLTKEQAQQALEILEASPLLKHEHVAKMFDVSRATLYRAWNRYQIDPPDPARMLEGPDK